jgi:hypothetical protein
VITFISNEEEAALREALSQSAAGQVRYVYRNAVGSFEVRTSRRPVSRGGDLLAIARNNTLEFVQRP